MGFTSSLPQLVWDCIRSFNYSLKSSEFDLGDVPSLPCDVSDSHMTVNACILMQPIVQSKSMCDACNLLLTSK